MKSQIRKILIRFLIVPVVSLIILCVATITVLYYQQQRLVTLAVKELNKRLPGKLLIGGSDISVFQNFPYVSIALKNVQFFASKLPEGKPIFKAEKVYAGFSMPDILKQQYHVKVIFIKDGLLDLVQDNNGGLNIANAGRLSGDTAVSNAGQATGLDLALKKIV